MKISVSGPQYQLAKFLNLEKRPSVSDFGWLSVSKGHRRLRSFITFMQRSPRLPAKICLLPAGIATVTGKRSV